MSRLGDTVCVAIVALGVKWWQGHGAAVVRCPLSLCVTHRKIFADFAVCGRTLSRPQVCLNGPGESKGGKWAQHRAWGQLSAWFCAVR